MLDTRNSGNSDLAAAGVLSHRAARSHAGPGPPPDEQGLRRGRRRPIPTTPDSVTRWRAGPTFITPAVVTANPTLYPYPAVTDVSSVSIATAKDWWVMAVRPSGHVAVFVTTDAGQTWKHATAKGLPVTFPSTCAKTAPASIEAVSATAACASVCFGPGPPATFATTDGGARWSPVSGLG